jgi:alanine racemase
VTTSNPLSTARIWADIDLSAVQSNARTVEHAAGVRLLPMVKAGAYGIGAVPVARALEQLDPWGFGVATIEEGVELRMAGITRPVIVFNPLQTGTAQLYLDHHLRPAIGDLAALREWTRTSQRPFHIEIDTGMARAGFSWRDQSTIAALGSVLAEPNGWEGVFTHFHSSDENPATIELQWRRFQEIVSAFPRRPQLVHAANSGAALRDRRVAGDMVRPGIFLYGGEAGGRYPSTVVTLRSRVVAVRRVVPGDSVSYGATWTAEGEVTLATLGCGYADGIHRSLSNRGKVELNGVIASIVGRVTMDMTMVAVPAATAVAPGDVATLLGGRVPLDQQAAAAGTIAYELLTSMSGRVERHYHQ